MSSSIDAILLPKAFPRLVTPRLVLDEVGEGDAEALFGIFRDDHTMRYWSTTPWTDARPARAMLERSRALFASGEAVRWAMREAEGGPLIATMTVFALSAQNRRAETGYIMDRAHWGRGYMREGMEAVLGWAFDTLGLHRIEADTDPRNDHSLRLLERLGFAREGLLRERWIIGGEICDTVLLGLLASDWRKARTAHG